VIWFSGIADYVQWKNTLLSVYFKKLFFYQAPKTGHSNNIVNDSKHLNLPIFQALEFAWKKILADLQIQSPDKNTLGPQRKNQRDCHFH